MDFKKEIIGAIQVLTEQTIQKFCPILTFGIVKSIEKNKKCVIVVDGVEQKLAYYGKTSPIVNQKYPVFAPFGNMSIGFILTSDFEAYGRNLLDNPWFTINQRGATTYSTSGAYSVDRWKCIGSTLTVNSGYIKATAPSQYISVMQPLDPNLGENLKGKKVTLSASVRGTNAVALALYDGTTVIGREAFIPSSSSKFNVISITVDVPSTFGNSASFYIYPGYTASGGSADIQAVKLELGHISTLDNDLPPDYVTELLKCQRFFYRINRSSSTSDIIAVGYARSTASVIAVFNLPVSMRTNPAISYSSLESFTLTNTIASSSVAVTAINGYYNTGNSRSVTFTASGLTTSTPYGVFLKEGYIDFSADL